MLLYPVFFSLVLNHVRLFAKGFEAFRLGIRPSGAIASDIGALWVGQARLFRRDKKEEFVNWVIKMCGIIAILGQSDYETE